MAKKRSPTKRTPSRSSESLIWTPEEEISLLSWLDHTLNHENLDFDKTIFGHLNGRFPPKKIELKLHRLWHRNGPSESGKDKWKDDFRKHGVSCLYGITSKLSDDDKRDIANEVQRLEDEFVVKQLQTPSRRLRKSSRSVESEVPLDQICNLGTANIKEPMVPYPKAIWPETNECSTPSGIKREIEYVEDTPSRQSPFSKRQRNASNVYQATPSKPPVPKSADSVLSLTDTDLMPTPIRLRSSTLIKDSEEEVSDVDVENLSLSAEARALSPNGSEPLEPILPTPIEDSELENSGVNGTRCNCGRIKEVDETAIECVKCKIWDHALCVGARSVYLCEQCAPETDSSQTGRYTGSKSVVEESINAPNTRLESALGEIENLQERVRAIEDELETQKEDTEEREREVSRLKDARKERDASAGQPFEEAMEPLIKRICELEAQLSVRREFGTFTRLNSRSREWYGETKIDEGFREAYQLCQDILVRHDSETFACTPQLKHHKVLQVLSSDCLGLNSSGSTQNQKTISHLAEMNPQAVIRALTTSALRKWVFESDFPQVDDGTSELLRNYRRNVSNQDGAIALRNLDLSALDSIIKDKRFREQTIPEEAHNLAVLLSQVLAPFFNDNPKASTESGWDNFATWGHESEEWEERRIRLIKMFELALTTKAHSCLNIEDYEMVTYAPGTRFDKNTMTVETMEGMPDTVGNHQGRIVMLCIEAAVYSYPRREISDDASIAESIITTRNFIRKTERNRSTTKPLVKAVVVLTDK